MRNIYNNPRRMTDYDLEKSLNAAVDMDVDGVSGNIYNNPRRMTDYDLEKSLNA